MEQKLTVSKVERDKFCFTGLDVTAAEDGIEVSMNDYIQSLKDINDIHKADYDKELLKLEMKEYMKMTEKIAWLANSTRSDLNYTVLHMSKKNNAAAMSNLRDINKIIKKLRERDSKLKNEKI